MLSLWVQSWIRVFKVRDWFRHISDNNFVTVDCQACSPDLSPDKMSGGNRTTDRPLTDHWQPVVFPNKKKSPRALLKVYQLFWKCVFWCEVVYLLYIIYVSWSSVVPALTDRWVLVLFFKLTWLSASVCFRIVLGIITKKNILEHLEELKQQTKPLVTSPSPSAHIIHSLTFPPVS